MVFGVLVLLQQVVSCAVALSSLLSRLFGVHPSL